MTLLNLAQLFLAATLKKVRQNRRNRLYLDHKLRIHFATLTFRFLTTSCYKETNACIIVVSDFLKNWKFSQVQPLCQWTSPQICNTTNPLQFSHIYKTGLKRPCQLAHVYTSSSLKSRWWKFPLRYLLPYVLFSLSFPILAFPSEERKEENKLIHSGNPSAPSTNC